MYTWFLALEQVCRKITSRDRVAKRHQEMKRKQAPGVRQHFLSCFSTAFQCFDGKKEVPNHYGHLSSRSVLSSFSTSESPSGVREARTFAIEELKKATRNFSVSCRVGQGGSGVVYKGTLQDGTTVAIKRARKNTFEVQGTSEFQREVNSLAKVEHLNLVKLLGYVEEGDERILVEEFVSNGNLRQHLDGDYVLLDFAMRLDIAIDVAHALTYLHFYADQPMIHRDVKASNILLTDSLRAKVADFGFSRTGPTDPDKTHVSTQVRGTAGYLDPEYLKSYKLTPKSDVFAFGILVVELFTGRRPIEQTKRIEERITVRWAYSKFTDKRVLDILDPRLEKTDAACRATEKIFGLAFRCSAPTKRDRPSMKQAGEYLWGIRKDYQALCKGGRQ